MRPFKAANKALEHVHLKDFNKFAHNNNTGVSVVTHDLKFFLN